MTGTRGALAFAALASVGACGPKPGAGAAADTTAAAAKDSAAMTTTAGGPSKVEGFQHPESLKYDPDLDVWYVTNVNGMGLERDGNGYISRLKGDGTVDSRKFVESGKGGVTLDAPKGMALQGDTLWVADIDAVRGFNRRTGTPVASLTIKGAKCLNDIAVGPDGLYITDTGVEVDAKGISHPGPDRVYRIAPDRTWSVALENASLAGPNGITWDGARGQFIIVPFFGKVVRAWTPGSKAVLPLGTSAGQLDGVEILDAQRMLITSVADSSLDVFENGTATVVYKDLPTPADIGLDTKRNRVGIPLIMENRIEFRTVPAEAGHERRLLRWKGRAVG
jgi:sugar lactone lactonase YvrE